MGKSKKKKKKSSSKAQYDAKKSNIKTAAKASSDKKGKKEEIKARAEEIIEAKEPADEPKDVLCENDTYEQDQQSERPQEPEKSAVPAEPPMPAAPCVDIPFDPDFSEEDFSASVNSLKAEDIHMPEETSKNKKEKKKISKTSNMIQIALLVICASVAAVCLFMLGENIWGKIKGQKIYSDTQSQFDGFTLDDTGSDLRDLAYTGSDAPLLTLFERVDSGKSAFNENTSGKYSQQLSQMKASLSAMKSKYPDIYGWIYVPETNINHPIVRCDDNNYYLTHTHTGDYLPVGAIFADLTTLDVLTDNYNTVIYGHNVMASGYSSMFHDVEKFLDSEFFNSKQIYIYTLDGAFVFKPVAIYDTVADDFYFKTIFSSEEDFLAFSKEKLAKSNIHSSESFASGDKMLTLSTCTNGTENGRYALHAKLVEVIK